MDQDENRPKKRKPGTFPKGKSGNPKGRPKHEGRIKNLRRLHLDEFLDGVTEMWGMREVELVVVAEDNETPIGKKMLARVLVEAAKGADIHRMNAILDRFFGKPKEHVTQSFDGDDLVVKLDWGTGEPKDK